MALLLLPLLLLQDLGQTQALAKPGQGQTSLGALFRKKDSLATEDQTRILSTLLHPILGEPVQEEETRERNNLEHPKPGPGLGQAWARTTHRQSGDTGRRAGSLGLYKVLLRAISIYFFFLLNTFKQLMKTSLRPQH